MSFRRCPDLCEDERAACAQLHGDVSCFYEDILLEVSDEKSSLWLFQNGLGVHVIRTTNEHVYTKLLHVYIYIYIYMNQC